MPDFEPPDWVTEDFLTLIAADKKMAARAAGLDPWPRRWSGVDLIVWWWETQGRAKAGLNG